MYLQTDKRWSGLDMDSVPFKIGRWGCTVTSVTNGLLALKMGLLNPKQVSDKLSFTNQGLLLWGSTKNVGLDMVSYSRYFNKDRAQKALKSPIEFCIVELDHWHWALVWSLKAGVIIYDPLFGIRPMWPKYKNITKTVILRKI